MSKTEICPICKKSAAAQTKPFCSKRCADIDLHRWLSGNYVVPGQDGEAMSDLVANENRPDND